MRAIRLAWIFSLVLLVIPSTAQQRVTPPPRVDGSAAPPAGDDETRDRVIQDMAKKANLARQAALKSDTEKLVKLAEELKQYVDKSDEHILSLDVVRKADEIEKLARSVKDKMKGPN